MENINIDKFNPDKQKEVSVKRYELWIAMATIIGTLIISTTSLWKLYLDKQDKHNLEIINSKDLRKTLKMPLEGSWSYTMIYPKFHGTYKDWKGQGRAIIMWDIDKEHYDVLFGGKVFSLSGDGSDISPTVTYLLRGIINSDNKGFPSSRKIHFQYVSAMGKNGFTSRSNHYFTLDSISSGIPNELIFNYVSNNTNGIATLTRQ